MNEKLFQVVLSIIPVLCTVITVFVIPYIKEKIGTEKLSKYSKWAEIAVNAAEMLWSQYNKAGKSKKEYAVSMLSEIINKKKEVLTDYQLDALIECAVNNMNSNK